jgi:hypothetical protein
VIIKRSNDGIYAVSEVEEKDRKALISYIDGLMLDSDLIPGDADKVLVNLKETAETLLCEVKSLSKN